MTFLLSFRTLPNIYYRDFIRQSRYTGGYPPAALIPMLAARPTIRKYCSHAVINDLTALRSSKVQRAPHATDRLTHTCRRAASFMRTLPVPVIMMRSTVIFPADSVRLQSIRTLIRPLSASLFKLLIDSLIWQGRHAQALMTRSHVQICRYIDTHAVLQTQRTTCLQPSIVISR